MHGLTGPIGMKMKKTSLSLSIFPNSFLLPSAPICFSLPLVVGQRDIVLLRLCKRNIITSSSFDDQETRNWVLPEFQ
ncbi:hypothetical protein OnM2_00936 [Erysiphe neolycopersici]|uniref:Uncharacterized protein n=1 Tax=Erysiphe neolycopersici TaxID=212602 RepID=A0A420I0W8_9PEZI|nr:hypothetical protein OnM2_00936 [Erysiphe neolycopersici]